MTTHFNLAEHYAAMLTRTEEYPARNGHLIGAIRDHLTAQAD